MKILLIGGTGLVGSYLLPKLIEQKHEVFALTRSKDKIPKINALGANGILGDIRNPFSFINNIKETDIIVLLAMPSVKPGRRMTTRRFNELKNETNDFFRNSLDLARKYNVPIILPGGTSYRTKENETADETWPIDRFGLTKIGADTDIMVNDAIRTKSHRVIQLIFGKIYGNGSLFRFMFEMMKKGRFRVIGNGENYIPNIHASDAASAMVKAIEKMPIGEKFIIVDNVPVKQKDFTYCMAELMHKKRPGKVPGFIIKMVLGIDMYQVITMNCKVSNQKARKLLDWNPEFPSYKEGLENAIKEMNEKLPFFA